MDLLGTAGIKVVLATPTAAPPIWLTRKHPEILPVDEHGLVKHEGTRRAVCLNSDVFWDRSKRMVEKMAKALGRHRRNSSPGKSTTGWAAISPKRRLTKTRAATGTPGWKPSTKPSTGSTS